MPLSSHQALARARLSIVALMVAFSMMSYFDRTIMSIAGPGMMREFNLIPTQMGVVYSAFVLGYALFMLPGGHFADVVGPRRALIVMGFGAALCTGLTALGANPGLGSLIGIVPALVVFRFLFGVVTAPLYPACARMCANWVPAVRLGRVQGVINGGSSIGGAIAPIMFQALMGRVGWRTSFVIAAAATAALTLVWMMLASEHPSHTSVETQKAATESGSRASWRALLTNRNLLLITASYATLGYFSYIFYYWIYYYFGEIRHMGLEQSARFTTVVFIVNGLMMPLGGWLSDKLSDAHGEAFGRRAVPVAGLTLGAVFLYSGTVSTGTYTTVCLLALAMGCASVCEGPFWAMTTSIGGKQIGAACGILNTGSAIAAFIAPVLTPVIASFAGWSWGLYFGCFLVLLGAIACWHVDLSRQVD